MASPRIVTIITYGLLAGAAAISFLLPKQLTVPAASAAAGPAQIHLTGIVRDFLEGYQDMEVVPPGGFGHYAGSVELSLDADHRPVFVEPGSGTLMIPTTNVVAHWTFDDGSGSTANDSAGPNDGTLINGPTWTTGPVGGALHFDGVNDYVNIPSAPEIRVTGDMTIAGWFKLDQDFDASSAKSQILVERYQDDEHNTMIALIGADCKRPDLPRGSLCMKVEHGPTTMEFRYKWTTRRSWTAGEWYHFACTIHSADSASNDILINGVDDTDPADLGSVGYIDTDYTADMRIGGRNGDFYVIPEAYFKGVIDDVMMYDTALEESDFATSNGGFKVTDQWTDAASRPIAPHLLGIGIAEGAGAGGGGGGARLLLVVKDAVTLTGQDAAKKAVLESWGHTVTVIDDEATQAEIDALVAVNDVVYVSEEVDHDQVKAKYKLVPIGLVNEDKDLSDSEFGFSASKRTWTGNTITILDNSHEITQGFPIGDLAITSSNWNLHRGDGAIAPGGQWLARLPNHAKPALIVVEKGDMLMTSLMAPGRRVRLPWGNHSIDFNTINANGLEIMKRAVGWAAAGNPAPPTDLCGNLIADTEGTAGVAKSGGITDAESFNAWYRDTPGVNLSAAKIITLTDDGAGVYELLTDAFYPIDRRLLGNEGHPHNNHFTFELAADFTFAQCTGQFVEFEGGDGVWVFVDEFLAIDLGGMTTDTPQRIEIDRLIDHLNLVDGERHRLRLFYAQRVASKPAVFRLRTNLDLSTESIYPTISAAFD